MRRPTHSHDRLEGQGLGLALRQGLAPRLSEVPPVRPWGSLGLALGVLVFFLATTAFNNFVLHDTPAMLMAVEAAILALVVWFTLRRRAALPPAPVTLTAREKLRWIAIGPAAVVAAMTLGAWVMRAIAPDQLDGIGHKLPSGTAALVFTGVAMIVLAPPLEDTVFRGWLMRSLTTRVSAVAAVAISGAAFGTVHVLLAHYTMGMGFELILAGMALALVCLHSGSMVPNIAGHMALNFTAFFSEVYKPLSDAASIAIIVVGLVALAQWVRHNRRHRHGRGSQAEPVPQS